MARGALTHEAIERMERQVDRAVDELAATGVDVIAYADMVTTFIMARDWNEQAMSKLITARAEAASTAEVPKAKAKAKKVSRKANKAKAVVTEPVQAEPGSEAPAAETPTSDAPSAAEGQQPQA
jgi:maleate cis-trans isomerase